jgi:hypothetical protein
MRHLASRGILAILTAFLAVTTIGGAVLVVPTLPLEWIEGSIFTDYTLPAVALGAVVGGLSVIAFLTVLVRPEIAGLTAILAGVAMIGFEIVEILAVGFSLAEYGLAEPVAWLQVVYIVIGILTAAVGLALWNATVEDRERAERTDLWRRSAAHR